MKNYLMIAIAMLWCANLFAQEKKTITDVYRGTLTSTTCKSAQTELSLTHELYGDEGTYTLKTMCAGVLNGINKGNWTVLRGDAADENATVVELGKGSWHFLQLKNGDMEQLDKELKVVKGGNRPVLKKEKNGDK